MKKFENFIYSSDEVLSKDECDEIVNYINENLDIIIEDQSQVFIPQEKFYGSNPFHKTSIKDDFNFFWNFVFIKFEFIQKIRKICDVALEEYIKKYPALLEAAPFGMSNPDMKYHIVKSGEGYHAWHSEWNSQLPNDRRILVWHISLTNHENEGELEFLYHTERLKPKAGRLVLWPAFFPWLHRGNAIRSDKEKHYITGWFYINHK